MAVTSEQVIEALRRVKGPDLTSNIVDLELVSEVLIKDGRAYFSITIPAFRAEELEPLRKAAAKVVEEIDGITGATAVLTADAKAGSGLPGVNTPPPRAEIAEPPKAKAPTQESAKVSDLRAKDAKAGAASKVPPVITSPKTNADTNSQTGAGPKASANAVRGVKHLIAVASGKGGVGKSTTAVNLALGLKALGLKVGILDADIYGPSQPRLLGLTGRPEPVEPGSSTLKPMVGHGVEVMSMGFMVDEGTPVVWRGPMVVSALNQMLRQVAWGTSETPTKGDLDCLVIDMPPGTGDVQLTIAQNVPLSGAVIVSTPQDLALIDARKGLAMFQKTDIPVLGIIENMSYFLCPKCGDRSDIFGHGGAAAEAGKLGVPFLGGIPLHMDIRTTSDDGQPITASAPNDPHAQIYRALAEKVWAGVAAASTAVDDAPKLQRTDNNRTLRVDFGDAVYELSAEMLRVMSPSAEVQGHAPEQRVTLGGKRNVAMSDLQPVGKYAVRIVFDDGHQTGLFTWDYLRTLGREKDSRWAQYENELAAKGLSRG